VYVILIVPGATPVTNPVFEIVAMVALLEVQGVVVAAVALPVSCVVAFTQTALLPVIVGLLLTVMVVVTEQPLLLV
jgi:hypothetical protein